MIMSEKYENEYLALRYALMTQSSDYQIKVEGIKHLLKISKNLGWVYYQDELVRTVTSDNRIFHTLGNIITESAIDVHQLNPIKKIEIFFHRLNVQDSQVHSQLICDYSKTLFSKGCFTQFNSAFSRFIKHLKFADDIELHEFVIKFFISSVIKKNFENAIFDINQLKNISEGTGYDLNIYTFLLKFIHGIFHEAAEDVIAITKNIFEGVWKLINENDLAFYFTLSQLISFNRKVYKEIQSNNSGLISNLFDGDYEEYKDLLDSYAKCRYDYVVEELEGFKKNISIDSFLLNNITKINFEIKNNILKEILNSCAKVELKYLSKILKEKDFDKIENWILSGISQGYYRVKIDDIDKIVYSEEDDIVADNVSKVVQLSKTVYNQSVNKILNSIGNKNDIKEIEMDRFKKYSVEKIRNNERRSGENDIYVDY